ncbi:winged helix-turn-helix transcriptional regulator [Paeniglutamicibacter cryotolerans]|uniref:DNA-binding HxlR family transcriptional regulator n=1 Tax=Paeniglutamicibacter cryotolerans TaxID=670079 RepID=A0A839QJQ8_9MICC|nr:helix-turn-helix domain-containing protein [Paeniglutamicibacter cryotolerans]MBB2994775.1 DNA-binding HxlR family transcriptional regulator [Paeniglutamicibacter cryotolerans]
MDTTGFDVMTLGCPSRVIMQRIGDKWSPLVIASLKDGPRRFSRLRNDIGGVTPKVLTQTLRTLERDGLIGRTVHAEVPVRVEYELSALGCTLLGPLEAVRLWAEAHAGAIIEARDAYDLRPGN